MAKNKRTPIKRENDLARIADLYLTGHKQSEIARLLKVSQPQISYDLKELQKRWAASGVKDLNEAKTIELAKIDELEATYWSRWRASQKPLKSTAVTTEQIALDEKNKVYKGAIGMLQAGQGNPFGTEADEDEGTEEGQENSYENGDVDGGDDTDSANASTSTSTLGTLTRVTKTVTERDGGKQWLDGVQWCILQRCKLLGLAAPTKIEHSGNILAEYINVDFERI